MTKFHRLHVCEGCGAVYETLGPYWGCQESHPGLVVEPADIYLSDPERVTEAEYRAALPGRMQEIAAELSACLPEGMRFEWDTLPPSKDACARCGRDPAAGYAVGMTGKRLCHPDPVLHPAETGEDCYHITQGGRR